MVPINCAERTRRCSRLTNHARFKHDAFKWSFMRLFLIGEPRRCRGRCFYPIRRAVERNRFRAITSAATIKPYLVIAHLTRCARIKKSDRRHRCIAAIVIFGIHLSAFKITRTFIGASALRGSVLTCCNRIIFRLYELTLKLIRGKVLILFFYATFGIYVCIEKIIIHMNLCCYCESHSWNFVLIINIISCKTFFKNCSYVVIEVVK